MGGRILFVGVESGLTERYGELYEEAWAAVLSSSGEEYLGYSSGLRVPDYIRKKMKQLCLEHGDVMQLLESEFRRTPSETWGVYTGGLLLREVSIDEAVRNAFVHALAPLESAYKRS